VNYGMVFIRIVWKLYRTTWHEKRKEDEIPLPLPFGHVVVKMMGVGVYVLMLLDEKLIARGKYKILHMNI
jgi:hypothetical protein